MMIIISQKMIIIINKIDILLISETHATDRTHVKIPYYTVYYANHPDNQAHAGAAIITRTALKHYIQQPYITNKIQSASVKILLSHRPVTIAAIYLPPRHSISAEDLKKTPWLESASELAEDYEEYLSSLGPQFIAAGDWNDKHNTWGSRLTTKGRNLLRTMTELNIKFLSTGEPTYWPADKNKTPDLLDFALFKGISYIYTKIEGNSDLVSDHSAITVTLSTHAILKEPIPKLCTKIQTGINLET
jgi:hypothetical protein